MIKLVKILKQKSIMAALLVLIVVLQTDIAGAHFIEDFCKINSVNVNNKGVIVYCLINTGPIYAPVVWMDADSDNDGQVNSEESKRWIERVAANITGMLDAGITLKWSLLDIDWPSSIATSANGEEDICLTLKSSWPPNFSGAHTLVIEDNFEEIKGGVFFKAFSGNTNNQDDFEDFYYTVGDRTLIIDFKIKPIDTKFFSYENDKKNESNDLTALLPEGMSAAAEDKKSSITNTDKNEFVLISNTVKSDYMQQKENSRVKIIEKNPRDANTESVKNLTAGAKSNKSLDPGLQPETTASGKLGSADNSISDITSVQTENKDAQQLNPAVKILAGMLGDKQKTPGFYILIFSVALLLGALHALTPGHGKTLVAAYLIGSEGTVRHAIILGAVVTLTHTGTVIILSVLALTATHFFLPQDIFPVLEILSGMLIFILGIVMFRSRLHEYGRGSNHSHTHGDHDDSTHTHHHGHSHTHVHENIPSSGVHMKSLLTLGVSGGMLPCPDAIAVLLVAVALNRILLGSMLIITFSLGLALVLIAIGIIVVRGQKLISKVDGFEAIAPFISVFSALVVLVLGGVLTYNAAVSFLLKIL